MEYRRVSTYAAVVALVLATACTKHNRETRAAKVGSPPSSSKMFDPTTLPLSTYREVRKALIEHGLQPYVSQPNQHPPEIAGCQERIPETTSTCDLVYSRSEPDGTRSFLMVGVIGGGDVMGRKVEVINWATAFEEQTYGLDEGPPRRPGS